MNPIEIKKTTDVDHSLKKTLSGSLTGSLERQESKSPINMLQLNKLLKLSNPNLRKSQLIDTESIPDDEDDLQIDETLDHNISALLTPTPSPSPSLESKHLNLSPSTTIMVYKLFYLQDPKRIHRVVLTGGPCAGKTTGINKIKNFFENIGWKVV